MDNKDQFTAIKSLLEASLAPIREEIACIARDVRESNGRLDNVAERLTGTEVRLTEVNQKVDRVLEKMG